MSLSILAILLCQKIGHAAALGHNCKQLFIDLNYNPGPAFTTDGINRDRKYPAPPYLKIIGESQNSLGVRGYVLRKLKNGSWYSSARALPAADQNDPRNFLTIVGPKVGRFFGFEMIDENTMIVPTPEALNERIELWNKSVAKTDQDKISVSFYSELEETPDRNYVKRFLQEGKLPIYATGITFIHDVSVHAPILFFSGIIRDIRKEYQFVAEYEEFARKNSGASDAKFKKLHRDVTVNIDGITGNFVEFVAKSELERPWDSIEDDVYSSSRAEVIELLYRLYDVSPNGWLNNFDFESTSRFFKESGVQKRKNPYLDPSREDSFKALQKSILQRVARWEKLIERHSD